MFWMLWGACSLVFLLGYILGAGITRRKCTDEYLNKAHVEMLNAIERDTMHDLEDRQPATLAQDDQQRYQHWFRGVETGECDRCGLMASNPVHFSVKTTKPEYHDQP